MIRGQVFRGVFFDPRALHATQPWKGFRISISALSVREPLSIPKDESRALRDLFRASVNQVVTDGESENDIQPAQIFALEPVDRRLLHATLSEWSADVQGIVDQVANSPGSERST